MTSPAVAPSVPTLVADGAAPPGPDEVQGVGFVGETADEADPLAQAARRDRSRGADGAIEHTPRDPVPAPGGSNARADGWGLW